MRVLSLMTVAVVLAACASEKNNGVVDGGSVVDAGAIDAGPCPLPSQFCFPDPNDVTKSVCVSTWGQVQALPCDDFPPDGPNFVTVGDCGGDAVLTTEENAGGSEQAYFDLVSGALVGTTRFSIATPTCGREPSDFTPPSSCGQPNAPPWCAAELGEAEVGIPCGDAGTCATDELCFNDISDHGSSWQCQVALGATCDALSNWAFPGCPGATLSGCAIDAGVVQCFAPRCDGVPSNYCFANFTSDGGSPETCVTSLSDVQALGCGAFGFGVNFTRLQASECTGLLAVSQGGIDSVHNGYFDLDSGALVAVEDVGEGYDLSCDPSLGDWSFPTCVGGPLPSWCDGGPASP